MTKEKTARIKAVVTAGPTVEPIDPVRFLSNFSTGEMGYKVAAACRDAGFETCLISGPVGLKAPRAVRLVKVTTAREMRRSVLKEVRRADCLIMAAAVCDFRPAKTASGKIKKKKSLSLKLVKNPDILTDVGKRKGLVKIGFALETGRAMANAARKLKAKNLDLIALNTKSAEQDPFGRGKKNFVIIVRDKKPRHMKKVSKARLARLLVSEAERLIG